MYFSSYFHNLLLYNNFAEGIILDYTCTYYKDSLLLQTETKNGKTGSYMLFLAFSHKKKITFWSSSSFCHLHTSFSISLISSSELKTPSLNTEESCLPAALQTCATSSTYPRYWAALLLRHLLVLLLKSLNYPT